MGNTMGMVFGLKLHALTNIEGLFARWAFAAANHADVRLARELTEGLEDLESLSLEQVLGDKACIRYRCLNTEAVKHEGE